MKDTTCHSSAPSLFSIFDPTAKRVHATGPSKQRTSKSDILISIKPQFMDLIVRREKNHEFRKYNISQEVKRMWLYVSSPDQTLRYVAIISNAKRPGEIELEDGVGNADFNAGLKVASYAYEVKEIYQLREPLPLTVMQERYSMSFPQRFSYVPEKFLQDIILDDQERLF